MAEAAAHVDEDIVASVTDELDLLSGAGNPFAREAFLAGDITPVFFGSALTNYGIDILFDALIDLMPSPGERHAKDSQGKDLWIDPVAETFSGYVFKMQANMNPKHRDCVAFIRINAGRYYKDMQVVHDRLGKKIRLARPHNLVVAERHTLDQAFPGDIIGIMNSGVFAIGDTISEDGGFSFDDLPYFQPELFALIRAKDLSKRKAIDKGLAQLVSEGAVQILRDWYDPASGQAVIGAVGQLQFDVLQYRLRDEYGVETDLSPLNYKASAWLEGDVETFKKPFQARLVRDMKDRPMVLFTNDWEKQNTAANHPDHVLKDMA